MKITGETPFQIPKCDFGISPSTQGYTLNYSADGTQWTAYTASTPANETCMITGCAPFMYWKCAGNEDTLKITF